MKRTANRSSTSCPKVSVPAKRKEAFSIVPKVPSSSKIEVVAFNSPILWYRQYQSACTSRAEEWDDWPLSSLCDATAVAMDSD